MESLAEAAAQWQESLMPIGDFLLSAYVSESWSLIVWERFCPKK
jgi:hypothetical protein